MSCGNVCCCSWAAELHTVFARLVSGEIRLHELLRLSSEFRHRPSRADGVFALRRWRRGELHRRRCLPELLQRLVLFLVPSCCCCRGLQLVSIGPLLGIEQFLELQRMPGWKVIFRPRLQQVQRVSVGQLHEHDERQALVSAVRGGSLHTTRRRHRMHSV